jgi:antitoxin component YwqK of YwqJK toxin-antitoxin module
MKAGANGAQVFHGPKISLYNSGKVEAVGQTEDGFQTGKWTFYNEAGVKVGETEFAKGDYNGRRVEYFPSGQVRLDEQWVAGKRQGAQKTFTEAGMATVTVYRDDRPVTK